MRTASTQEHVLQDPFPAFLGLLDRESERAAAGFHEFAWRMLLSSPPPSFRSLEPDERHDLIADLVLRCVQDNFEMLRKYRNEGKPFAGWLATVANFRAIDYLRKRQRHRARHREIDQEDPDGFALVETLAAPGSGADEDVDAARMVERVKGCMDTMSERCQVLLQGAADGLKPRELTALLGWPRDANKKLADAVRECRRTLKRCIERTA